MFIRERNLSLRLFVVAVYLYFDASVSFCSAFKSCLYSIDLFNLFLILGIANLCVVNHFYLSAKMIVVHVGKLAPYLEATREE
jgi:hypothetical protein